MTSVDMETRFLLEPPKRGLQSRHPPRALHEPAGPDLRLFRQESG